MTVEAPQYPVGAFYETFFFQEALRVLIILACLALVVIAVEFTVRRYVVPGEWSRKVVHMGCGFITLSFPWVFSSAWAIGALVVVFSSFLILGKRYHWLTSVYSIPRRSYGDLYFIMAIFVLFLLAHHKPIFYLVSVLTLTVSDALAALLGTTYKKLIYLVETEHKSAEGSVAFFFSTFLLLHIPLLLLTDIDRVQCVMMSAEIALVLTCLEAICLNGFDNFVIPVATTFMLVKMSPLPASALLFETLTFLAIIILIYLAAWKIHMLSVSGAITAQLFLFATYTLGGHDWVVAPALAMIAFGVLHWLLRDTKAPERPKSYAVLAVFYVALMPTIVTIAYNLTWWRVPAYAFYHSVDPFYVVYIGVIGAQLAIILFRLLWLYTEEPLLHKPRWWVTAFLAALAYLFIVPFGLWVHKGDIFLQDTLVALAITAIGPAVYHAAFWYVRWPRTTPWEFRLQTASVLVAVLLVLPWYLQRLGVFCGV